MNSVLKLRYAIIYLFGEYGMNKVTNCLDNVEIEKLMIELMDNTFGVQLE